MNTWLVQILAESSKYKLSDKRGFIIELAILCACRNRGQRSKPSVCTVVKMQKAQPQRTSAAALRSIFKASASLNAILLSKQRRCFAFEASGSRTKPDAPPTPRRAPPPERPSALHWFGSVRRAAIPPFHTVGDPSCFPARRASAARRQGPMSRFP